MTVDLRSDTVTLPSEAMKQAMFTAPLGDDVLGDDPSVLRFEAAVAQRAGKEAAVFVPSGTMANLIALCVHTQPGDEVLLHEDAHPIHYETAGAAAIAGVQLTSLPGEKGFLDWNTVSHHVRARADYSPKTTLLCIEDTTNRGGGTVYEMSRLTELWLKAKSAGLNVHIDGARGFNAEVASGVALKTRVQGADSVSLCFSKGLGAPVGSALCGSASFITEARRVRKRLGGGMRQSGMLAAAAHYALEHHVAGLAEDHRRARELAMGLLLQGVDVQLPQTNMVYVTHSRAAELEVALAEKGVLMFATSATKLRMVFHRDIQNTDIPLVLNAFAACYRQLA